MSINEVFLLSISSAMLGLTHTLVGPDHYLPFIVIAKARNWSLRKTILITALCGLGHISSTVILGSAIVGGGILLSQLEFINKYRENLAGWLLILFGLFYTVWGIYFVMKNKTPHIHLTHSAKESFSNHHKNKHILLNKKDFTPWVLFTIFVLSPCTPLILLFLSYSFKNNVIYLIYPVAAFSVLTILTMILVVTIAYYGINLLPLGKLEKYFHSFAGLVLLTIGIAIMFFEH